MLAENRKTVKPVGFTEFYVNQILLLHSQKPFFATYLNTITILL